MVNFNIKYAKFLLQIKMFIVFYRYVANPHFYWRKYVHEVLVNRLGGLSLPRKSVVRLTDRPDMTLDVYRGRKTTMQQCNSKSSLIISRDTIMYYYIGY